MSWTQILGHDDRIASFRAIVQRGRLAHAYLFVGPEGVGKRRFAQELAKALLCEAKGKSPGSLDACDQCDACLQVDAGTHPDLFMVRRPVEKNEFPIEVMKGLCRDFSLKSARGHGKVGILDDADDLNEESANAFLKTLEEPPPGSVFILIGTTLDQQLPTIKSRCQLVRFAPLPEEHVRALLKDKEIGPTILERVVRLAAGSPGLAVALADEKLWDFRGSLLQAFTQAKVDSVALGKSFTEFVEEAGKETSLQRDRAYQALRLIIEAFADVLRVQSGLPARSADSAELPRLNALAQRADADKIHALLDRCLETETQLGRYVQISLVLDGLMDAIGQLLEHSGPLPLRYQGFAG